MPRIINYINRIPNIITKDELRQVIKYIIKEKANQKTEWAKYNKMRWISQLLMIYYTGTRPNEVRLIKIKNINFQKKEIYIPTCYSKMRQDDFVKIPDFLFNSLLNFLKVRSKLFFNNPYLFPNIKGTPSDRNRLSKKFCDILKKLNISKESFTDKAGFKRMNKNLYSLRHTFGTFCYSRLRDIKATAVCLRHHDPLIRCAWRYVHTNDNLMRGKLIKELYSEIGSQEIIIEQN